MVCGQPLLLALAQVSAELQHAVALRQPPHRGQLGQYAGGQRAAATADLDDVGRPLLQYLCALTGDTAAEQRRQLGGGDEVALFAQLAAAGAVIAQTGGVKAQLHVAMERDPATGRRYLCPQQVQHALTMGACVRVRRRQLGGKGERARSDVSH